MKKLIVLFFVVSVFFLFNACEGNKYQGFKEIEIPNMGSMHVPEDWIYGENDNCVYFGSLDTSKIHMIGCEYRLGEENGIEFTNLFGGHISNRVGYEGFSNSTFVGTVQYTADKKCTTKYYMKFYITEDKRLFFVVLDDTIDYNTIKKICKSFVRLNQ